MIQIDNKSSLSIPGNYNVTSKKTIVFVIDGNKIEIPSETTYDFSKIDSKYHELLLNTISRL